VSQLAKQNGFTLVEMVIAITILGVTMALAYAALHVVNRTMSSVSRVQTEVEALRTSYFVLSRHLSQARNQDLQGQSFQGYNDQLTFYSSVPMRALGGGRIYRFQLYQKYLADDVTQLLLSYASTGEQLDNDATTQVLAQYSGHAYFSYYADSQDETGEQWQDSWFQPGLPQLVRLRLDDNASAPWPEQVVRLRYAVTRDE